MDRIYAGSNIRIEVQPDRWLLLLNTDGSDTVLAEAAASQPLRYISTFGSQRRLPLSGQLAPHEIERVVIGWSAKDEAWHLGLLLTTALAQARSSRWCELAHWPDPSQDQFEALALQAGKTLAQRLSRPFTVIPPRTNGAGAPSISATPAMPLPPLAPLPLRLDLWTLKAVGRDRLNGTSPDAIEFRLSSGGGRGKLIRAGWYVLWAGVFFVLSVSSLTEAIALPRPEWLPYLGVGSGVFLVLLALINLVRTATRLNRIVIDPVQRIISGGRGRGVGSGRGERWRFTGDEISAVYASQVVNKVNRRRGRTPQRGVHYGELSLLLDDGSFVRLIAHGALDDKFPVLDPPPQTGERLDPANQEKIVPLTPYDAQTPLQAAALYVAGALRTAAYTDQRVR